MAGPARRPRPLGPLLTASLALHLSLLILLLVTIERQPRQTDEPPPADFAMVFEGHSPERSSGPNPELNHPPRPGSPAPAASVPAVPSLPPSVAILPPPPPRSQAEVRPAPAPPTPPLSQASPAPPVAPQAPASPDVGAAPAEPAPPVAPLAMAIPRPPPVPVVPSPSETPRAPRARPERTTPSRPGREPAFPTPLAFSFGLPGATAPHSALAPRSAPLPGAPARISHPGQPGTLDLSFGQVVGGSLSPSSSVQMEGVAVSTDWLNLVSAWWRRHAYYPPQAGVNGEEGDVMLHMRVDHDGRVEALELIGHSGSQWLDLGGLSIFRDAHLPPLPQDMPEAQIPFHVTIHYVIVRQR